MALTASTAMCSTKYDFDPELPKERRRRVLTIVPVHWAAEWLRPVTPDYKLVGPVLSEPGKPLPAYLEVSHPCSSPSGCTSVTDIQADATAS